LSTARKSVVGPEVAVLIEASLLDARPVGDNATRP
jgi:hypothetical protein